MIYLSCFYCYFEPGYIYPCYTLDFLCHFFSNYTEHKYLVIFEIPAFYFTF